MKQMQIVKILRPFMNKSMEEDLIFYLRHDKELYFKGMAACAVLAVIITAFMLYLGILFIRSGIAGVGIIIIFQSWAPLTIFIMIKMYLHIRKDNIENAMRLDSITGGD